MVSGMATDGLRMVGGCSSEEILYLFTLNRVREGEQYSSVIMQIDYRGCLHGKHNKATNMNRTLRP